MVQAEASKSAVCRLGRRLSILRRTRGPMPERCKRDDERDRTRVEGAKPSQVGSSSEPLTRGRALVSSCCWRSRASSLPHCRQPRDPG